MIFSWIQRQMMHRMGQLAAVDNARQAATELHQQRIDLEQTMEEIRALQSPRQTLSRSPGEHQAPA